MQSPKTHEQFKRVIERKEVTSSGPEDIEIGKPLEEASVPKPSEVFDMETGDRSIKHGANQQTEHHKTRRH